MLYHGPVRVPAYAPLGDAKLSITLPKDSGLETAEFELPVVIVDPS